MAHLERVDDIEVRCLIPAPLGFWAVELVAYLVAGLVAVTIGVAIGRLIVG